MQSHINLPYNKNKSGEKKINKLDTNSKFNEMIENILEINLKNKEFKKSNSSSYLNKFFIKRKKKENENEKLISNDKSDISNNIEIKNNLRKNFILKSEFNLSKDKNNNLNENKINNNILINAQLNQINQIINNTSNNNNFLINNIQNYSGYNFPPSLNNNYSYLSNPYFNNNYSNYNNNKIVLNNNIRDSNHNFQINRVNNTTYINLAKTQSGSKYLIEKIKFNKEFANDILYKEIKNNLKEIYNNIYGSSLLTVLLKQLNYENSDSFLTLIKDDINNICLTESGSHIIQSLIENIHKYPLLLNKFIFYLNNKDIKKIFISPYGNHIIKYYISIIKQKEFTNFIYSQIYNNFIDIVREKYGVCVAQQCFSKGDEIEKNTIIYLIIINLDNIMKDNFGNYLIQYIFINGKNINFELLLPLIIKIEENLVGFCKHKYSASVLEKCFEKGDEKISEHFLNYLLEKHSDDIINIASNQFGFYVIKKSLYIKNNNINKKIFKIIEKEFHRLKPESKEKKLIKSLLRQFTGLLK